MPRTDCRENFDAPGTYWVDFEDGLDGDFLDARIDETDARIAELFIRDVRLVLVGQMWVARVGISPKESSIRVFFEPEWPTWRSSVRYVDLLRAIPEAAASRTDIIVKEDLTGETYAELTCELGESTVLAILGRIESSLARVVEQCVALAATRNPNAVVAVFDFPSPVASACKQYLLHFAEFLRDIGVEAATDLHDEAGQLLFTVTPARRTTALSAIRQALDVYLRLPTATLEGVPATLADQIATDKLQMNVHHLKAQLASASMMLRLQEATIDAQQCAIDAQRRLIDGANELQNDREALIPGVLDVVPAEFNGARLDLPELLRKLKKLFS
ncbi:MAG: hypothetical protein JO231_21345 [Acidobacteria bacterium]|nr:hypothetical protein [Acidobacteriota bacterium]